MLCYNCGTELEENAVFCSNCGKSQQPPPVSEADTAAPGAAQAPPTYDNAPYPPYDPNGTSQPYDAPLTGYDQAGYTQQPYDSSGTGYNQGYQQPGGYQYPNGQQQPQYYQQDNGRTAPLVLGIIGIIFAIIFPLVTYCTSIPGLVMANTDIKQGLTTKTSRRILNIVAICIAGVNSLLGVMFYW